MGQLFPVHSPGVEVFSLAPRPPPLGDALSLAALAQDNSRPSESTLRTREKIGLGEHECNQEILCVHFADYLGIGVS